MSDCAACGWRLGVNPRWCAQCREAGDTTEPIGKPLSVKEMQVKGFKPGRHSWHLARPLLCIGCRTRPGQANFDGQCEECFTTSRVVQVRLPFKPGDVPGICRWCKGYLATSPEDGLCDGCGWEKAETVIPFTQWRELQAEALRRIERLKAQARKQASA